MSTSSAPIDQPQGSIVLVRHGEPALSRRVRLSSPEYRAWWARYEEGGILSGQTPPASLIETARRADVIYSSTRLRAIETSTAIVGERSVERDIALIEAPLPPPPLPNFIKFSPKIWGFVARVAWWFFGYTEVEDQETRPQAEARAAAVADRLIAQADEGKKVLVVAHGFFNTVVGIELKKRGWRCVSGRGYRYWTAKQFERA